MKTEIIKAIFTNILFVMGVGFAIFGFIRGTLTVTRMFIFDVYPLPAYEETRCIMEIMPVSKENGTPTVSEAEQNIRRQQCEQQLEKQRNIKQTEDIVTAISTLVVGIILIISFKRFIFTPPSS